MKAKIEWEVGDEIHCAPCKQFRYEGYQDCRTVCGIFDWGLSYDRKVSDYLRVEPCLKRWPPVSTTRKIEEICEKAGALE